MTSKKKVSVSFVGEEDILQPIIPINEMKQDAHGRKRRSCTYKAEPMEEDDEDVVLLDESTDLYKPSEALVDEADLKGGEVFGFQQMKRKTAMMATATESVKAATPKSPTTPKSKQNKSAQGTPKSRGRKSILKSTPGKNTPTKSVQVEDTPTTPQLRKTRGCAKNVEASTPFRLRARNKEVFYSDSDGSMSGSEDEDEESEEDEEENKKPAKSHTPAKSATPAKARKRRLLKDEVTADDVENYFSVHAMEGVTSDHTLSRLDTPRMDQEAVQSVLSGIGAYYVKERKMLYKEYRECFNQWMFHLCNGFNLIFHGVGSKRTLLEDFRKTMLHDFTHVVVNGYFPSITIKTILNSITEDILEHTGSFRSPVDQCEFIRKHYECGDYSDFYLIIHNIDGAMLRPDKTQTVLSLLAQIRGFHIIASIDHINAPLIWDQNKASRFNWLWFDTTTYDPYAEETSYENSLMVQQSGSLALSSMTHVMKSLTPNARGIFILLVKYQLENKDNPMYQGLAFPDLYQKCWEAFLVNSDQTLRTQLTEFKDHKLIRLKKLDGTDYLVIPLDDATLKEFLEQHES